jgi:PepSY-associated TM region
LRRFLIYAHRWLGISGCVLFVAWFASGIVMMYVRMPEITAAERIARLEPLDLSAGRVSPADLAGADVERVRINMLAGRPVYRFAPGGAGGSRGVYADSGEALTPMTQDQALDLARRFAPEQSATLSYASFLSDPDQWTLSGDARRAMPLHRIALGDRDSTEVYISQGTGEVVMRTTARGRRWAYAGAIPHWLYFTPLRRHGPLWTQTIIWLSTAGCALCLSGLVWGIWRISLRRRYRLKREYSHSPYAGLMRWHHYAGLLFGVAAFTWIFSGLLSMDPWDWHPSNTPTRQQRDAVAGGPLRISDLTLDRIRASLQQSFSPSVRFGVTRPSRPIRELEIVQFRGERFLVGDALLVSLDTPERGSFAAFADDLMLASAREAMPGVPIKDTVWLEEYDAYYYDRTHALRLPVLRLRYLDPQQTWLYLDPSRGSIVRKEERLSRANRWLYHGLHSLDFRVLYARRPLWDIVVITLSLGGLVVSATTLMPAGHRLKRHWRRLGLRIWSLGNLVIW